MEKWDSFLTSENESFGALFAANPAYQDLFAAYD